MSLARVVVGRLARASGSVRQMSTLPGLKFDDLVVTRTDSPKEKPADKSALGFGKVFSDHMLTAKWTIDGGWGAPHIHPVENLSLHPASTCLHYGLQCFEGMKAYRGEDGKIRQFRPDLNIARFNKSSSRLAMPTMDPDELKKCIAELVRMEKDWIPEGRGYSMYIRPTMLATSGALGVGPSQEATMFVLLSPVGAYYSGGFQPIRLLASTKYARAWPGGVGDTKCGGNYAPTIKPQQEAVADGCDQILWLMGDDHSVTEAGTSNFFVHWVNSDGVEEVVTAPLDGTILEGVTRQAVIDLLNEGSVKCNQYKFTMADLTQAIDDGRVKEVFASGTAVTICPIKEILYEGKMYSIPIPDGTAGENTKLLTNTMFDIQYGVTEHDWAPVIA